MTEQLQKAQQALEANRARIDHTYKPRYHLSVPAGWLNDPNGFGFWKGKWHLFYQFHPYDSVWGPMHWGHWSGENLMQWREEPVALAPDTPSDAAGCFSGTALAADDTLYVIYTGVSEETPGGRQIQQQCMAESQDGIRFTKWTENPVIGRALLPEGACAWDFRDPKIERMGDGYRVVAASRGEQGGQLLSFRSEDLRTWRYEGVYAGSLGEMSECPDTFELDDKRVVIVCVMGAKDEHLPNSQPVVYMVGEERDGAFLPDTVMKGVDWGHDFYAPQTALAPDGRRILIGWALGWGQVQPTHTLGHGWAGMMTLPRECSQRDGVLYQKPAKEVLECRRTGGALPSMEVQGRRTLPECAGACREIEMTVDMRQAKRFTMNLMETGEERFVLNYDKATEVFSADRAACGYPLTEDGTPEKDPCVKVKAPLKAGKLKLHVFVDVSIIEIYLGDGETVLTCLAYPKAKDYGVSVQAEGLARVEALSSYAMA